MWIEPVTDRTQDDLKSEAKKAFRDAETLNRVETDCQHLSDMLGVPLSTKDWAIWEFPEESEILRIVQNISKLRHNFIDEFGTGWDYIDSLRHSWDDSDGFGVAWDHIEWFLRKGYLPGDPTMPFIDYEALNSGELILYYIYIVGGGLWQHTKQRTG